MPTKAVLGAARQACRQQVGPVPIALAGTNDNWSVYIVGTRWLAVGVHEGETLAVTELAPKLLKQLPLPLHEVDRPRC